MTTRIALHRLGVHQGQDDLEVSCGILDIYERGTVAKRVMIDCGVIPVNNAPRGARTWTPPDLSLLDDGKKIDAVFITHVHGDHVGYLPAAMPYMANGAGIYLTKPSAMALPFIMEDSMKVSQKRAGSPPWNQRQKDDMLSRLRIIGQPGQLKPLPGLTVLAWPAGHINGAASYTFRIGGKNVHFAGDNCSHDQTGIRGGKPLPAAWRPHVIAGSDCTYGSDPGSDTRDWREEMDRGVDLCADALKRDRPVLFFSFGLHRGPAIAHELQRRGLAGLSRICLDGACRKFADFASSAGNRWSDLDDRLETGSLLYINRKRIPDRPPNGNRVVRPEDIMRSGDGYAVITTPGMAGPGGAGISWRRRLLADPDALVVFTSYVAPGTDGDRILKAVEERTRTGIIPNLVFEEEDRGLTETVTLPLRCQIERIRIGSHDSQSKIVDWFRSYSPETAVLTHGSRPSLAYLKQALSSDIPNLINASEQSSVEIDL